MNLHYTSVMAVQFCVGMPLCEQCACNSITGLCYCVLHAVTGYLLCPSLKNPIYVIA